tara:strand:- start:105657 stop:106634 length:978 start_codon:yes stop_codon:yes gene_type:complete
VSSGFGRIFDNLLGNQSFKDFVLARIQNKDLRHCNILTGTDGIGKKSLAAGIAQELFCEEKKEGKACGFCPNCIRTAKHAHENLLIVGPEAGSMIKMESAKEIQKFLQLQNAGKARVIIIDQAEKLNPSTSNSLLKTLEEPPEGTYFFLITNNHHQLLETIRSRSQMFRLKALPTELLRQKTTAEDWQVHASGGSFGALQTWREDSQLEFRSEIASCLENLDSMSFSEIKESSERLAGEKAMFPKLLELIGLAIRDAINIQIKENSFKFFPDQTKLIEKLAKIPREKLFELDETCFNIEQKLKINVDRSLHLTSFLLKLKRIYTS